MDGSEEEKQGVTVISGQDPVKFYTSENLDSYMKQYPEAENDQACRLFKYTPKCSPALLMTMFSNFDFTRFSMFPYGLTGQQLPNGPLALTGICTCEKCRKGELCGKQAMQISLACIMPEWESIDQDDSLRITLQPEAFAIHMQNKIRSFRTVTWSLQVFRFRSRRLEHIEYAYDALVCHTSDCQTSLSAVPINYVLTQVREILNAWNSTIYFTTEYLGHFRFEILEQRLEYDRQIIRNLLVAARTWETFRKLHRDQTRELYYLYDLQAHPRWIADSPDLFGIQTIATGLLIELAGVGQRIENDLISDTNTLIQQITNLISIDEGYRSRDQNSSVRRLSWITFIFLPLLFAASIFGMNVDLFKDDPSWVYYIYLAIPLFITILTCYALLKYRRRMLRAVGHAILRYLEKAIENNSQDSERALAVEPESSEAIIRWAASAGRVDVIRSMTQRVDAQPITNQSGKGTPLLWAIRNGHQDIAEILIEKSAELNAVDEEGATALHWAARHGMSKIAKELIAKGADMHVKDKNGEDAQTWARKGKDKTLRLGQQASITFGSDGDAEPDSEPVGEIFRATAAGDLEAINLLHSNGTSLEHRDSAGRTVIFHAVTEKQTDALKLLLDLGAAAFAIDKLGFTPLHLAAQSCNIEATQLLIDRGSNVSTLSNSRITPLLLVDSADGVPILEALVRHGADVNARDSKGSSIAHVIAGSPAREIDSLFTFLVSHNAILDGKDNDGNTPAHIAARAGNEVMIRFLKNKNVDIEGCRNEEGLTPLMLAVKEDHTAVVGSMLRMGISPNILLGDKSLWELAVRWGKSGSLSLISAHGASYAQGDHPTTDPERQHPIWDAIREKDSAVVLQLIDSGNCDINMTGQRNISLLEAALETSNTELVEELIERGAKINTVGSDGWTPLHSAAFSGNAGTTKTMLRMVDKTKLDNQGWMALDLAAFYRHEEVWELLDPGKTVKTFAWQLPKDPKYRVVDGQRRRNSWTPDRVERVEGRAEAP